MGENDRRWRRRRTGGRYEPREDDIEGDILNFEMEQTCPMCGGPAGWAYRIDTTDPSPTSMPEVRWTKFVDQSPGLMGYAVGPPLRIKNHSAAGNYD